MLTRYRRSTPSTSTATYRDPFYSFVDRFFNEFAYGNGSAASESGDAGWMPAMDIVENEGAFVATADLPGLTKEDIDLSIEDGVLTLSGERKFEHADTEGKFRRIERSYGRFTRSFSLPQGLDHEKVSASFDNGVLTLTLPKSDVAKSRKIDIS